MGDFEYWLRLGLHGRFLRIPEVLAAFRVHPGSQTFGPVTRVKAEEPVRIISGFFEKRDVPEAVRALRDRALSTAQLVCAQLHLRSGNWHDGSAAMLRAFKLSPWNLFTPRSARMLVNALFNRLGHRLVWGAHRAMDALTGGRRGTGQ